jgi:hypothetical protein
MDSLTNQRIAEIFVVAMIISIGTPVCILLGDRDGERLANKAYGAIAAPSKIVVPVDTVLQHHSPDALP